MSSIMKAAGSLYAGSAARKAARSEAKELRKRAKATRATSQRAANEERRDARYVLSRARALAASQGGSLDDPTMVNVFADIEAEGEYNALSRLFEGESAARADHRASKAREREGNAAMTASYFDAASSFAEKYG